MTISNFRTLCRFQEERTAAIRTKVQSSRQKAAPRFPYRTSYFRCPLISLVISNIETCAFLKISFSLASALIIVRFAWS